MIRAALAGLALLASPETPPQTPKPAKHTVRATGDSYTHARELVDAIIKPWDLGPDYTLPPEAEYTNIFNHQKTRPPLALRVLEQRPGAYRSKWGPPPTLLLGDMLYHAPALLGPKTQGFGLSCDSCHPNGGTTTDIFFPGESDRKGNIDLLFNARIDTADDGVYAPRNVPGLRGVRYLGPFLHDGSKGSLAEVVDGVVGFEFGQPLRKDFLSALTLYVGQFDFLPNGQLDDLGNLTAKASAAAHRGEALFKAPRAAFGGAACATCHIPSSFFTDHLPHRFRHGEGKGTTTPGEAFVTATLMDTSETAPYFFDGSARTLGQAVELIDARHQLGLTAAQRTDLTAYLEAVGAVEGSASVPTLATQLEASLVYLDLLLDGPLAEDAEVWTLTLETVRHGLHDAVANAPKSATRTAVEALLPKYEALIAGADAKDPNDTTRAALQAVRSEILAAAHVDPLPDPSVARKARAAKVRAERQAKP